MRILKEFVPRLALHGEPALAAAKQELLIPPIVADSGVLAGRAPLFGGGQRSLATLK